MRVVGGNARGLTLCAPKGLDTRPTADRVREALFNILARRVPGARVLDLFAGTGALGVEALSRGAEIAFFCDKSREALACVRKNLASARVEDRARVYACDFREALSLLRGAALTLAFLDPPYRESGFYTEALDAMTGALAEGARVVMEHPPGERPEIPAPYAVADERKYGKTALTILEYTGEAR